MAKIQLTEDQFDTVLYNLEGWTMGEEATVRRNYSGQGMYGATCVGIVHDGATVPMAFLAFIAEELDLEFLDLLERLGCGSRDSMGLSSITYWRGLTVEGADQDEDD